MIYPGCAYRWMNVSPTLFERFPLPSAVYLFMPPLPGSLGNNLSMTCLAFAFWFEARFHKGPGSDLFKHVTSVVLAALAVLYMIAFLPYPVKHFGIEWLTQADPGSRQLQTALTIAGIFTGYLILNYRRHREQFVEIVDARDKSQPPVRAMVLGHVLFAAFLIFLAFSGADFDSQRHDLSAVGRVQSGVCVALIYSASVSISLVAGYLSKTTGNDAVHL